jgi:hypothetical protein
MIKTGLHLIVLFSFLIGDAYANFAQSINTSLGMTSYTLAENPSNIKATDDTVTDVEESPSSAAVSATSFEFNWEFKNYADKSYFVKAIVPLVAGATGSVFLGGFGGNFFFNSLSSVFFYSENGNKMTMVPKFRSYWGFGTGIGYVVYSTESAKKADVFFDLGLHLGASYSMSEKWGLRAEAGFARGTGIETTSTGIKIFFGTTYFLGN